MAALGFLGVWPSLPTPLEVSQNVFLSLSLRSSFSCVGFTWEQFSSVLMNLVSFKNPALSQLSEFVTSLQCFYVKQTDSSCAQSVPVFSNRGRKIHKHSPKLALRQLRPPHAVVPTLFSSGPQSCGFWYFTMVLKCSQHLAALIPQSSRLLETHRKKNNRKEETFQGCC